MRSGKPASEESLVHFTQKGHIIFVKVHLNNSPKAYNFIFDTGSLTAIDNKVAKELNIKPEYKTTVSGTSGKEVDAGIAKLSSISLGNTKINDLGAYVFDLSYTQKRLGVKVDGILGNNFLRFFKLSINYQTQTLGINKEIQPQKKQKTHGINFYSRFSNSYAPAVICQVDSIYVDAIIDTGAKGMVSMPMSVLERMEHPMNEFIKTSDAKLNGLFGPIAETFLFEINLFKLGDISVNNIISTTHQGQTLLLGSEFLSQFIIEIDYPRKKIQLYPLNEITAQNIAISSSFIQKNPNFVMSDFFKVLNNKKKEEKTANNILKPVINTFSN